MRPRQRTFGRLSFALLAAGCARPAPVAPEPMSQMLGREPTSSAGARAVQYRRRTAEPTSAGAPAGPSSAAILARVNGRPILHRDVFDLMLRSHGVTILEQLVGLETAHAEAERRGVTVSDAEVKAETDRALRRLADPLAPVTTGNLDRAQAERLLEAVLAQRNLSREVFKMVMRRNAILRKLVGTDLDITDAALREEYERAYGERVRVRHIQLATAAEVARVEERLAESEDFAELARRYSANRISAAMGGLLEPFTRITDDLPRAFREAAFRLAPGEISPAVRVGDWYHLIKLEERVPAGGPDLDDVRPELERRLRNRLAEDGMLALYERLFNEAKIEIYDPVLRETFERKRGE